MQHDCKNNSYFLFGIVTFPYLSLHHQFKRNTKLYRIQKKVMTLLSVQQAAERLNVSTASVYIWCRTGKLPHIKIGKTIRIKESDLYETHTNHPAAGILQPEVHA